jgi:hypothetical protein
MITVHHMSYLWDPRSLRQTPRPLRWQSNDAAAAWCARPWARQINAAVDASGVNEQLAARSIGPAVEEEPLAWRCSLNLNPSNLC